MKFRLPLTLAMAGLALAATPVLAEEQEAAAPAAPALSPVVDTDPTHQPENVL